MSHKQHFADRAGGVRDDLSGVFSWLYELMRRSTSAECGFAASNLANTVANDCQHSTLRARIELNISLGFISINSFKEKLSDTLRYDATKSHSGKSGTMSPWQALNLSLVVVGRMCLNASSSLNSSSGILCVKNSPSDAITSILTAPKLLTSLTLVLCFSERRCLSNRAISL